MRSRVFLKLLAAFILLIAIATLLLDIAIRREWEKSLRGEITQSLIDKARMLAARVEDAGRQPLQALVNEESQAANARVTVIDASGRVLADSKAVAAKMENHAGRPEVVAARAGHVGIASRTSKTVGIEFLYVAVPVNGGVARLAYPLSNIEQSTALIRRQIAAASLAAVLIATLIAAMISNLVARRLRRIVQFAGKIAEGDFSARIAEASSDEIAQVAGALDVTARRLQESFAALQLSKQQLETLLDSIPNPVIAVSSTREVLWTNKAMQMLDPRVKPGTPDVETFRNPDMLRALHAAIHEASTSSVQCGPLFPGKAFTVTAAPMPGGGAVAVLQDTTEIERVEKTRRDFIANVSHELRTPLTSIQGFAETVQESYPPEGEARRFLDIIQKNAVRMVRLTEDLLVLARVESGEDKLKLEPLRVSEILKEAKDNLNGIAESRSIRLEIEHAGDYEVIADRFAIQQVLTNLIDNAIKYSCANERVIIGSQLSGGTVEFYVRDSGRGIAWEHQQRLFERFYRVDASRSRESGGTGLGLAIVKHIILNHGGSMRVESALNHGSVFFFTLPLA